MPWCRLISCCWDRAHAATCGWSRPTSRANLMTAAVRSVIALTLNAGASVTSRTSTAAVVVMSAIADPTRDLARSVTSDASRRLAVAMTVVEVLLSHGVVDAMAWVCPMSCGLIHTSRQVGGIASAEMRSRVWASTALPSWPTYQTRPSAHPAQTRLVRVCFDAAALEGQLR